MGNSVASGPDVKSKQTSEVAGDCWKISLPKTRIHTLEQLIDFFEIDLSVWEIERFVANKWEVGAKDDAGELKVSPLFQVKAFLRRKHVKGLGHAIKVNARLRSQVEKLRVELGYEHQIAKRLAVNHAGFDDVLRNVRMLTRAMGDFTFSHRKPKVVKPPAGAPLSSGHSEDAVLLLSDTHFGDVIRREDTSGFPEFDLVIGANRLGYVIRKAKQVLALHRAVYPIKTLHVWFGGDMGNGALHDAPESNELLPPAQVHFAYHILRLALESLLTLTEPGPDHTPIVERIKLLFTVGNHMRISEKMPYKLQAQRTLDWLIYQFLIAHFEGNPRVDISSEFSPFIFCPIRGHRYMFAHGMQVGYKNNPEKQSAAVGRFLHLARALFDSPQFRAKNGLTGESFSRVCVGDIHIPVSFPRFKSNGSLNGQNELGINWTLDPIPAGQQIFGVSEDHQETWAYFLECTHIQKTAQHMNDYGDFAAEYLARLGKA